MRKTAEITMAAEGGRKLVLNPTAVGELCGLTEISGQLRQFMPLSEDVRRNRTRALPYGEEFQGRLSKRHSRL